MIVVSFGEALWDLLPTGAVLGGAPLNFSYRALSLGHRSVIISRLGRDSLGQKAFEQIKRLGMESEFIQWDESYPTGTVDVRFVKPGQPDFTIVENVAYDRIELSSQMIELVESADCLCFGTLIQRSDVSRRTLRELLDRFVQRASATAGLGRRAASRAKSTARTSPAPQPGSVGEPHLAHATPQSGTLRPGTPQPGTPHLVLLDINLRRNCYTEETIKESIDRADILKLNEDEAPILAKLYGASSSSLPAVAQSLMEKTRLAYCVVTLGPKGVFAASAQSELLYLPTYRVNLEDSCGAGDAFTAGFIHCLLSGESLKRACQFGNAMGALVAGQTGATQPLSLGEVEALIKSAEMERIEPTLEEFLP